MGRSPKGGGGVGSMLYLSPHEPRTGSGKSDRYPAFPCKGLRILGSAMGE